ncbi:protein LLP homolog [Tetranychus urticae]|uniref:Protein LLP homolog n=1 Tax=Tetranychus urticae TaxID=32264 RepID=T1K0Z8_TETUR|nr:protein LLP homolog [Tetranychus urticae]
MAKSLRSKFKRKMRAIKRVRYGQKELDRLKKMLAEAANNESIELAKPKEIDMKATEETKANSDKKDENFMEIEKPKRNAKTLMDQHGTFPVWVHPRQRRKLLKRNKAKKKNIK